jgi:adenylate cyclase class IV
MLEIEKRGFLTEEKYNELLNFLEKNGTSLGADDKEVIYYIYPDKLLKVVHNLSKNNAKISLKTNKVGGGSVFPETEVFFDQKDFEKIKYIFDTIAKPEKVMDGIQKRINFEYKGCEIAIKWSEVWGFHFEIEKMVSEKSEVERAEEELQGMADELEIKILNDEELKEFTKKAEQNFNKTSLRYRSAIFLEP